MDKRTYGQSIRWECILAVILIHALDGYDYSNGTADTSCLILR